MVLSSKGGICLSAVICIRLDSGIKNYNLITTLIVKIWRLSLNLELLQQISLTLTARFLLDMDSRWWQSWDVSHRKIFHRWPGRIVQLFGLQSLVTTYFFSIWTAGKKLILTSWAPSTVVNVNNALDVTTISRLQGVVPVRCCKVQSPPPARWLSKDIRR